MPIRFTIKKGGEPPWNGKNQGTTVRPEMISHQLIDVREIKTDDYNPNNLDHYILRLERGYQLWFISDAAGPRVSLYVPIGDLDSI